MVATTLKVTFTTGLDRSKSLLFYSNDTNYIQARMERHDCQNTLPDLVTFISGLGYNKDLLFHSAHTSYT